MKTTGWPERFPVDKILECLELDENSFSGLKWRNPLSAWVSPGQPAGSRNQGGWIIRIDNNSYKCDHIVLLMNGCYPEDGQVCTHADGDVFNNAIDNIRWVHRSDKLYRERISARIAGSSTAYQREFDNLNSIRDWFQIDPNSPTGLSWRKGRPRGRAGAPAGCLLSSTGEYRVTLDSLQYSVARLVLWLSGREPEPGQVVMHVNGQRADNSPTNLEWISRSELARRNGRSTSRNFKYVIRDGNRFVSRYRHLNDQGMRVTEYVGEFSSAAEAEEAAIKHQGLNPGRIIA